MIALKDMNRRSILLIEDDKDMKDLLKIRLEKSGYIVNSEETAIDGLRSIAKNAPDLIILDLGLPDMNGLNVVKYLQSKPELSLIPVIIFTAHDKTEEFTNGMSADNVVTFLEKPISKDELITTVRIAIRKK